MTEAPRHWIIRLTQEEGEGWDGIMWYSGDSTMIARSLSPTREDAFKFDSYRSAAIAADQLHSQGVADNIDVETTSEPSPTDPTTPPDPDPLDIDPLAPADLSDKPKHDDDLES